METPRLSKNCHSEVKDRGISTLSACKYGILHFVQDDRTEFLDGLVPLQFKLHLSSIFRSLHLDIAPDDLLVDTNG